MPTALHQGSCRRLPVGVGRIVLRKTGPARSVTIARTMSSHPDFRPIILAGGSGTRFWPRSRKARAKQVLALDGERTMIQRTLDRLNSLTIPADVWVITNDLLDD